MKNIINRVTFYVLRKIRKQYILVKQIEQNLKNELLRFCIDIFITIMSFLCAYIIKTRMKKIKNDVDKFKLDDVHSH